jgi:hypothetical protein
MGQISAEYTIVNLTHWQCQTDRRSDPASSYLAGTWAGTCVALVVPPPSGNLKSGPRLVYERPGPRIRVRPAATPTRIDRHGT